MHYQLVYWGTWKSCMNKVLYIDCCIRRELSRTRFLAESFLKLIENNAEYEFERLCLMDEPLHYFVDGFFQQRERLIADGRFDHPRFRYAHQFQQANKIIIAAPFWDLSFPALLKVYIENLCVEGITFGCDETGTFGTCQADRMLYLTTRGDDLTDSPLEMGVRYLEAMSIFFGIKRFDCIASDGMDLGLEAPQAILARAVQRASALVVNF